ncbi:MAG: transketolase [Paludibacteraceae bacterium]|nr:transketolase [Paludibacteraceae bacterium]
MENCNSKLLAMYGQSASMFGMALPELAAQREDIVVLAADQSVPAGLDKFKSLYPDRFFNVGIAEQNMIGIAAGLSDEGYLPVCVAQACFLTMRAYEPIRQYAGYMRKRMILVGLFSGFTTSLLGNTHYAKEDIALMRAIPGMRIVAPADAMEAVKCFESAVCSAIPVYIRLWGKTGTPIVYQSDYDYELGKAIRLREGKDIQLVATGSMVVQALEAAALLAEDGIEADVINMHTVKPLDASLLDKSKPVFAIEEHSVIGGLGDALNDIGVHARKIGIADSFGVVGKYGYLLEQNNLTGEKIKEHILKNLKI